MTKATITPVVLTGGSGTRLWPLSRAARPKQFLSLIGEKSMLEETLARVEGDRFAPPLLVGAESQADMLEALAVDDARIILEPIARNTAPAIALAALSVSPDTQLLVMPSDHVITDNLAFESAITKASELAAEGWLVTFGIAPGGPETGYGYIREGEALGAWGYRVESFVEKPDEDTAQAFLDTGCWRVPHQPARPCTGNCQPVRTGDDRSKERCPAGAAGAGQLRRGARDLDRLCGHGTRRAGSGCTSSDGLV
jgi:mannose-1-phosphate guanylyltransferase/mannose-1-phosphate guanylyltransferase/mannose-6-phosphate isomerase